MKTLEYGLRIWTLIQTLGKSKMKKIGNFLNQDLSVKMPRVMKVVDRVFDFLTMLTKPKVIVLVCLLWSVIAYCLVMAGY